MCISMFYGPEDIISTQQLHDWLHTLSLVCTYQPNDSKVTDKGKQTKWFAARLIQGKLMAYPSFPLAKVLYRGGRW